jgi:hypothetical protein
LEQTGRRISMNQSETYRTKIMSLLLEIDYGLSCLSREEEFDKLDELYSQYRDDKAQEAVTTQD